MHHATSYGFLPQPRVARRFAIPLAFDSKGENLGGLRGGNSCRLPQPTREYIVVLLLSIKHQ